MVLLAMEHGELLLGDRRVKSYQKLMQEKLGNLLSLIRVSQFFGAVFMGDSRTLSDSLLVAASR